MPCRPLLKSTFGPGKVRMGPHQTLNQLHNTTERSARQGSKRRKRISPQTKNPREWRREALLQHSALSRRHGLFYLLSRAIVSCDRASPLQRFVRQRWCHLRVVQQRTQTKSAHGSAPARLHRRPLQVPRRPVFNYHSCRELGC